MLKTPPLYAGNLTLAYDEMPVVDGVDVAFTEGAITTIIGPNGCGKSTLLRALARLLRPSRGAVLLDGQAIQTLPTREVARRLGVMHQQQLPPQGVTVEDLVRRGRYPHQSFLQPPSRRDAEAVEHALHLTDLVDLRRIPVDHLSGGQRQRAWLAMALAQETPLLLLDEPTTYLDIAHQLAIIELIRRLNVEEGRTIVMVLHDINEAARISHRIVALKDGVIARAGPPEEVLDPAVLHHLYGVRCDIHRHPATPYPLCIPRSATLGLTGQPSPTTPMHGWGAPRDGASNGACLSTSTPSAGVVIDRLRGGYGGLPVLRDVDLEAPEGAITAIIGPNACGKSTLLRVCGRLLRPAAGVVTLHGADVWRGSHRAFARRLALLAQGAASPSGFLVEDVVAAGRAPHQTILRQWRREDERAVDRALGRCGLDALRLRDVATLSGGQRQRAWLAMALAQETPVLLLDEPTTFLDIAAQVELLDLVWTLNREEGRTIVMVLHDINLAARYADLVVAMRAGRVAAAGPPDTVVNAPMLRDVFGVDATVMPDPRTGRPLVLPHAGHVATEAGARR